MEVYKSINDVQAAICETGISKSRINQQGAGYKFRGIDDVYNAVSPLLAKHGLCVLPRVISRAMVERLSKQGGALFYTTVEVEFDFVSAKDGSKHLVRTVGEAMDSGDKSTNKAMSAAYKYALLMAFGIPTEGDNDTENSTHEVAAKPAEQDPRITDAAMELIALHRDGKDAELLACSKKVLADDALKTSVWAALPEAVKAKIKELKGAQK